MRVKFSAPSGGFEVIVALSQCKTKRNRNKRHERTVGGRGFCPQAADGVSRESPFSLGRSAKNFSSAQDFCTFGERVFF